MSNIPPSEPVVSDMKNKIQQDYEYISNDPAENADNFDPKWAFFREMMTDEERYKAIRKIWGNADIPDPQTNLTYRHIKGQCESDDKENCKNECDSSAKLPAIPSDPTNRSRRNRQVSRRRSRSCTRPYEQLISNLEKNYTEEYSQLIYRHNAELQEMLQIHHWKLGVCNNFIASRNFRDDLQILQENEVINLLMNQYKEVNNLLGEKKEGIDACIKYMEEVKAFFMFYQKINDDEVTLQMTDEQYEHTVETEKMYSLYSKFYR